MVTELPQRGHEEVLDVWQRVDDASRRTRRHRPAVDLTLVRPRRLGACSTACTPTISRTARPPAGTPTKEAFADSLADLMAAFPDLQTKVDDLVIDEVAGRVAVRWSSVGTNRTTFLGIGPTGRQTSITGIEIIEIRDGRIVRRWGEWDISGHVR